MKKITNFVFTALIGIILIVPSCTPDELCSEICQAPDSIGISNAELLDGPSGVPEEFITFIWPVVAEANSYELNIYVDGVLFETVEGLAATEYTANIGNPTLDTEIEAEVASNCNCGTSAFSPKFSAFYKNGGGTSDIVLFNATKQMICESNCDFVRFPDRDFNRCDNTSLYLGYSNSGYIFYSRSQLCNCLNTYADPCDALANMRTCLDSTPRAIKDGFTTCP